jgi:hypothetical protein
MALPLSIPTPKPPPRTDDFADLERLDRSELDEMPDTDRDPCGPLSNLEWEEDNESGVKRRARDPAAELG